MRRWIAVAGLLLGGGVAWAAPNNAGKASFDLPSGAKLIGTSEVKEVRAFPEMSKATHKNVNKRMEDIVAAGAVDNVYETKQGYKDAVGFFDAMIKNGSATQTSRTVTRTATGWELQLSDGSMRNIIVRNTQPTTIETIQAADSFQRDTLDDSANKPRMPADKTGIKHDDNE
jgi:hypothetical protein